MHPRIAELFGYIDREHAALRAAYESVPAARRALRPSAESWSVDDVIGHLTLLERRLAVVFGQAVAGARERGVPAEASTDPILPRINVERWHDRRRRITGSAAMDPRTDGAVYAWEDYEKARQGVKDVLLGGDGLALEQVHLPHIVVGPLTLYEWIGFLGGHAKRHADQIREIDASLSHTAPV